MTEGAVHSKDEIELVEIMRVVWKWKYLIVMGTLICGFIAGLISWKSPKIYRISMVLQPAVLRMDEFGNRIQIDSAANMKALIEERTFKHEITDYLKSLKLTSKPGPLTFRVTSPKRSRIIKILYETPSVETGITVLNQIPKLLLKKYADSVRIIESYFEEKIKTVSEELLDLKNEKSIAINDINILQKQLSDLNVDIDKLQNSNNALINKRNDLVNDKDATHLSMNLQYNNAIQENLRTIKEYRNQLLNLVSQQKKTEIQLKRIEEKIDVTTKRIAALNKEKDNIHYIQVLQTPTSSRSPIRPKPKVAVLVASVTGLFLMVVASFFIEYISRYRSSKHP